jgi:serine O-acetyltransferase
MGQTTLPMLRSDAWRIRGQDSLFGIAHALLTNRCFKPIATLRMCQAASRAPAPLRKVLLPLCVVCHQAARHYAGMDLPWQTVIGVGISIQHGWGAVINSKVRIGNNVTLYHGVTIGQADRIAADGFRSTGYPIIEDEVWIGPHAIVVGGITIGQGSRIAAGSFVTESIPPFSLVAGNPAKVLRTVKTSDVLNPFPSARIAAPQPQVSGVQFREPGASNG